MPENTMKSNLFDIETILKHIEYMLEQIQKTKIKTTVNSHVEEISSSLIDLRASLDRIKWIAKLAGIK